MGHRRLESPLARLVRVLGGVVLMEGRLGHQVLGQLLVTNTTQIEVAGAALVVTASSGRRNAFARAAIATAAPALVVQSLTSKADRRLTRRAQELARREQDLARREQELAEKLAKLRGRLAEHEDLESSQEGVEAESVDVGDERDATPSKKRKARRT